MDGASCAHPNWPAASSRVHANSPPGPPPSPTTTIEPGRCPKLPKITKSANCPQGNTHRHLVYARCPEGSSRADLHTRDALRASRVYKVYTRTALRASRRFPEFSTFRVPSIAVTSPARAHVFLCHGVMHENAFPNTEQHHTPIRIPTSFVCVADMFIFTMSST